MSNADTSSLKTCFKCGTQQPRSEFYKHPMMGDGLLGKCKTCTKRDAKDRRAANIDRIREYDKARAKLPHRVIAALAQSRKWRNADRRRVVAHSRVAAAVRAGRLEWSPCCICGSEKSMAHHESYDRPLDVVWYCQVHHSERHKQMRAEGITP